MKTEFTKKEILIIANTCAGMMYFNDFLTLQERQKIHQRILKFQKKHKIDISQDELTDGVEFKFTNK